jgi:hypothetical protein
MEEPVRRKIIIFWSNSEHVSKKNSAAMTRPSYN